MEITSIFILDLSENCCDIFNVIASKNVCGNFMNKFARVQFWG
jgi:hypothetical protein